MPHPGHPPDRSIVAQIQAICPELSVDWVDLPNGEGRWAVFHDLQVEGRYEESVERVARALQTTMQENGHMVDLHDCEYQARQAVHDAKIVFYVTEDDGSFRNLDGRDIEKLQRMDYYRRNFDILDWKTLMSAKGHSLKTARDREMEDTWDCIRRDKVLASVVSDILWGVPPTRSIYVKGADFHAAE